MRVCMIVAADDKDVIGRGGQLPWHLPEDLARFKRLTTGHVVLAGRRTQDSIVDRLGRPLPGRITVVVTRQPGRVSHNTVLYQPDTGSALGVARAIEDFAGRDEVFVIGGAEIFAATLPEVDRVYLTRVAGCVDGDTAMPAGWLDPFHQVAQEQPQSPGFTFLTYERG